MSQPEAVPPLRPPVTMSDLTSPQTDPFQSLQLRLPPALLQSTTHFNDVMSMDPEPPPDTSLPTTNIALDEYELFSTFTESADYSLNLALGWTNLPTLEVEPIVRSPSNPSSSRDLSAVDRYEEVPAADLAILHQKYFDVVYYSLPFLSKERFNMEISENSNSHALHSLSYAVALISCCFSSQYARLHHTCYDLARNHAEQCERHLGEGEFASLNLLQALLFIVRFEAMSGKVHRAWMTLGRAVKMSKMLGLHRMDRVTAYHSPFRHLHWSLPPTQNSLLLEERRRTFWTLYILESHVRTRTGMKCELGDAEVRRAIPNS